MSGQPWEDRRGMFQRGKEVHEPGRKLSGSGGVGIVDAVRRASTSSNTSNSLVDQPLSNDPAAPSSPTRRSSAASSGLFGNLTQHKRGSEDYEIRRASHSDQHASGGAMAGWFNSTFRGGIKKPSEETNTKRGVME